jgi:signal transduction histidine kinase
VAGESFWELPAMSGLQSSKVIVFLVFIFILIFSAIALGQYYLHLKNSMVMTAQSENKNAMERIVSDLVKMWKVELLALHQEAQRVVESNMKNISKALGLLEETHPSIRQAFLLYEEALYLSNWTRPIYRDDEIADNQSVAVQDNPQMKLAEILEYQDKNYDEAIKIYEQFWLQDPNDFFAANSLARCLFKKRNYERAEKIYLQIYRQNPQIRVEAQAPLAITAAFQLLKIYDEMGAREKSKTFLLDLYANLNEKSWQITANQLDYFKNEIVNRAAGYQNDPKFSRLFRKVLNVEDRRQQQWVDSNFILDKVIPLANPNNTEHFQIIFPAGESHTRQSFYLLAPFRGGTLILLLDYLEYTRSHFIAELKKFAQARDAGIAIQWAGQIERVNPGIQGQQRIVKISNAFPDLKVVVTIPNPNAHYLNSELARLRVAFGAGYLLFTVLALLVLFALIKQIQFAEIKSDFVSHVSHELKTPLTSIRMFSELLMTTQKISLPKRQKYYQVINQESIRLTRLIENLLDLSRIEKKKSHYPLTLQPFDPVIESAAEVFRNAMGHSSVDLHIDHQAKNLQIRMDRDALIQMLINLLDNARKFSPLEAPITLSTSTENEFVLIAVKDTGIGMSRQEMKKVFRKFFQVKKTYEQQFKGIGLGLSIVKDIVAGHHGRISLESEQQKGTTITVRLPITRRS